VSEGDDGVSALFSDFSSAGVSSVGSSSVDEVSSVFLSVDFSSGAGVSSAGVSSPRPKMSPKSVSGAGADFSSLAGGVAAPSPREGKRSRSFQSRFLFIYVPKLINKLPYTLIVWAFVLIVKSFFPLYPGRSTAF
jgi:hypothetical protein